MADEVRMLGGISILAQRRIEAGILGVAHAVLEAALGSERARDILAEVARRAAFADGRARAAASAAPTDLRTFAAIFEEWRAGGALEIEVLASDARRFDFNVTRCRYAEMYAELGLGTLGHLLSCGRDGALCRGYDERIRLTRSQTLMQGASHCDFRFELVDVAAGVP